MPKRPGQFSDATARFLLVDEDRARSDALAGELLGRFSLPPQVVDAECGRKAIDALRAGAFDIVLVDLASLADLAPVAEEAVARLVKFADGALTIALSDSTSVSASMAVMRGGAHDCAARPLGGAALAARIGQLARRHGKTHLFGRESRMPGMITDVVDFIGASSQMQAVSQLVGRNPPESVEDLQDLVRRLTTMLNGGSAAVGPVEAGVPPLREAGGRERRAPILPMWRQEQRIIEEAIASFSGNVALAAAALELSPSTIYRKRQAWAEMDTQRGAA